MLSPLTAAEVIVLKWDRYLNYYIVVFFFFQAEDGIRDHCVTGVQTCALPIFAPPEASSQTARARRRPTLSTICKSAARCSSDRTRACTKGWSSARTRARLTWT